MGVKTIKSEKTAEILRDQIQKDVVTPEHPDLVKARAVAKVMADTGLQAVDDNALPVHNTDRFSFKLSDGRKVVMGQPTRPHILTLPDILDELGDMGPTKYATTAKTARVMQYIRELDGKEQPGFMTKWSDIEALVVRLGDSGVKAVYNVYDQLWPDDGSKFWVAVKNE